MGTYVDRVPRHAFSLGPHDAQDWVESQINFARGYVTSSYQQLQQALEDYKDLIMDARAPQDAVDFEFIEHPIAEKNLDHLRPTAPTIDDIDAGARPTKGDIVPVTLPDFPTIPEFTIQPPTATFEYQEPAYVSVLANTLSAQLLEDLSDDGEAFALAISNAIYTREYARLDQRRMERITEVRRVMPSMGWNVYQGATDSLVASINREHEFTASELQQKMQELQSELQFKHKQFTIDASIRYEGILREFFNQTATRLLESARLSVQMIYDIYKTRVEAYKAQLEATQTEIQARNLVTQSQIEYNKSVTEIYKADIDAYTALLNSLIAVVDAEAKVYAAEGDVYRSDIELARSNLQIKLDEYKAKISQNETLANLSIKEAEVNLQAYIQSLGLNMEAAKTIATILMQIVASSLGAIHTSIGASDDMNRSISEQHSFGQNLYNNLNEQHTIEEE